MRMKKNAIGFLRVALIVAAFALPSFAQYGGGAGHMGDRHGHRRMPPSVDDQVKELTKELNLTDDQKAKVKSILEDQQKQMSSLREDSSLSPEDRRSKFQEIRQSSSQNVRATLNKDQQKKFDDLESKRKSRMEQRNRPASQPDQQ